MLSVRKKGLAKSIAGSFEQSAAVSKIRTVCDPVLLNAGHHSENICISNYVYDILSFYPTNKMLFFDQFSNQKLEFTATI